MKQIAAKLLRTMAAVKHVGSFDDVCQLGRLGAVQGARTFDPRRGIRFSTYAGRRIAGAILDAAREAAIVKVPRRVTDRGEPVFLTQTVGDFRPRSGDDRTARDHWLASIEPREEAAASTDASKALEEFRRTLGKREKLIWGLYWGLDGLAPLNMREVGEVLGLSESRVSQVMGKLLEQARQFGPLVETQRVRAEGRGTRGEEGRA